MHTHAEEALPAYGTHTSNVVVFLVVRSVVFCARFFYCCGCVAVFCDLERA